MKLINLFFAIFLAYSAFSNEEGAFLDAPYKNLEKFKVAKQKITHANKEKFIPKSSNFSQMLKAISPVRSQGSRGTCSIFSATAMLEAHLIRLGIEKQVEVDLSEEWLEYAIVSRWMSQTDGSDSFSNFKSFYYYGTTDEEVLPYISSNWKSNDYGLAATFCGHLEDRALKTCLLGHRDPSYLNMSISEVAKYDPDFAFVKKTTLNYRNRTIRKILNKPYYSNVKLYGQENIKRLLNQGIPVTLGISFYYGAWNHKMAEDLEIGRDLENWNQGIVGYPEPGSMDASKSKDEPAGHSILIVGYDDKRVVRTTVKMEDGSFKTFKYKGVYYFKNSWGVGSFGSQFTVNGVTYPGYGMITYKHAHRHGGFYQLPVLK